LPAIWLRKLNLNVHLHILALDGAYTFERGTAHFHRAPAPGPGELEALLSTLITRTTRTLVHCTRTCRCREAHGCARAAIAEITEPALIAHILQHLRAPRTGHLQARAPPAHITA